MLKLHYKRLKNKFFFFNYKLISKSKPNNFEFYVKLNNPKDLLLFSSFVENFIGQRPIMVNAGYNYNTEGKRVYSKNLVLSVYNYFYIENFLKYYFLFLNNKNLRVSFVNKYIKNFYSFSFMNNSFDFLLVNNYFSLIDILFEVKLKFISSNKFLNFYYINSIGIY